MEESPALVPTAPVASLDEPEMALGPALSIGQAVVELTDGEIDVSAVNSSQMAESMIALYRWATKREAEMQASACEMETAYKVAVKNKWRTLPLRNAWKKFEHLVNFYTKVKTALRAGYIPVPDFQENVTLIAIRTNAKKPSGMVANKSAWAPDLSQKPKKNLPAGEGEYVSPLPIIITHVAQDDGKTVVYSHRATAFDDVDFPLKMAKPQIMEATTQAMLLKVFDEIGVLPARQHRTADPMVIARIVDPRAVPYSRRVLTFLIGWRIETRDI